MATPRKTAPTIEQAQTAIQANRHRATQHSKSPTAQAKYAYVGGATTALTQMKEVLEDSKLNTATKYVEILRLQGTIETLSLAIKAAYGSESGYMRSQFYKDVEKTVSACVAGVEQAWEDRKNAQAQAQELSQLVEEAKQSVAKHEPFVIKAMAFVRSFIKAKGDAELTKADNISLNVIRQSARSIKKLNTESDMLIDVINSHVEALSKTLEPTNKKTHVPSMIDAGNYAPAKRMRTPRV